MEKIEVNGTEYPVEIYFEEKKTSSATMRDGKILLRVSAKLDAIARQRHIDSLLRRLKNILSKGRTIERRKKFIKLNDGHVLKTFHKVYTIKLMQTPKNYSFGNLVNDMIIISLPEHFSPRQKEKSAYSLTRKLISQDHLIELKWLAEDLNRQHFKSKINNIRIKEQTSSWGTCSPDNNINISFNTLFLPKELLNYVVAHEVAHTVEHNHSRNFWKLVERAVPNFRQLRMEIKRNGLSYLPK